MRERREREKETEGRRIEGAMRIRHGKGNRVGAWEYTRASCQSFSPTPSPHLQRGHVLQAHSTDELHIPTL